MKKNKLFILLSILLTGCFYSCSNEEFDNSVTLESQQFSIAASDNDSIIMIDNIEDLFDVFGIEPETNESTRLPNTTRSTLDIWRLTSIGYDNIKTSSKQKLAFSRSLAQILNLSYGVGYHCYTKTLTKVISTPVPRSLYQETSLECGYFPNSEGSFSFEKRGYFVKSLTEHSFEMKTFVFYVDYDMRGNMVRKHFPCSPELVTWLYLVY